LTTEHNVIAQPQKPAVIRRGHLLTDDCALKYGILVAASSIHHGVREKHLCGENNGSQFWTYKLSNFNMIT
jgi:hypothetical protein